MSYRDEEIIAVGLLVATAFLYLNVSRDVGTFFSIAIIGYLAPVLARRKDWFIEYIKGRELEKPMIIGVAMLIIWIFSSSFLYTYVNPTVKFSVIDTIKYIRAQTNIPVLSEDPTIRLITFGVIIPLVETALFLSLVLLLWSKLANIPVQWNSRYIIRILAVSFLVGVTASLYHMSARMMSDFALMVDVVFFFLSALIVFKYNSLIGAGIFHILVNSIVLLVGGI